MGGRESRGGPGSQRAAAGVVGSDVTALEEPCTRSKGESHRAREGGVVGGDGRCTVGILSSESAPEEPIATKENR